MRTRLGLAGAIVFVAMLVSPGSGSASTTIGSNLTDGYATSLNCNAFVTGCTASSGLVLAAGSRAPGGLTSPINGVVVRWRLKSGVGPAPASLRILRPGNSTTRAGAGTSAQVTPADSAISTFDTRLPITAGDTIGVDSKSPPTASLTGTDTRYWAPTIPDGGAASASSTFTNFELLLNADIEADADHDGYGDESQDLCPNEPATHDGCLLTIDLTSNGGSITGPGIDCPGDCSEPYPGTTVVNLVAHPDKGFAVHQFDGPGCHAYPGKQCDLTIFTNETVTAAFADVDSPDTTIVKGPKKKTSKSKVKFRFRSDEPHSTFQCALDHKRFKGRCTSPYKAKVDPGKHFFLVRAIDAGDLADRTPAKLKFKVVG
jgi:hypothetical protein